MVIYTIPRKMSGTGTIHDIENDLIDRDIHFGPGCRYAVVTAAYYGGRGYTTHKTEATAIKAAHALGDYSHAIIDTEGRRYAAAQDGNLYRL